MPAVLYDANNPIPTRWLRASAELLTNRVPAPVKAAREQIVDDDGIGTLAHIAGCKGAACDQGNAESFEEAVAHVIHQNSIRRNIKGSAGQIDDRHVYISGERTQLDCRYSQDTGN